MFSTSLPPGVCASATAVLKAMQETDMVERLTENAGYLRSRFREEDFNILHTETAIIPLIVGNPAILTKMSKDSFEEGIIINPIFPPAVPANLTRFRISVMSSHTREDMEILIQIVTKLFARYELNRYIR
jgi:7-keto-8-aminopelargonate synthetase-like enzyme